jgi:hypothetical protein
VQGSTTCKEGEGMTKLTHWECYAKLYGQELMTKVRNYILFGGRRFYNYSINLPINEVVNALPACIIKLDSGVYAVTDTITGKSHIRGKGVDKTIIGGVK